AGERARRDGDLLGGGLVGGSERARRSAAFQPGDLADRGVQAEDPRRAEQLMMSAENASGAAFALSPCGRGHRRSFNILSWERGTPLPFFSVESQSRPLPQGERAHLLAHRTWRGP